MTQYRSPIFDIAPDDALGNVTSRTDGTQSPALTESFTYDGLDRLCTAALSSAVGPATVDGTGQCPAQAPAFTAPQSLANGTAVTNKWLDYNYLGDILTKSDVGTYRYTKVHKIASIALNTGASLNGDPTSPVTLGYDGNGNVTSGPNRTIAYTSYNLPSTIVSNGKTQTWLYDDQHRRFQRSDASSVRYYWDGGMPMEWDTGAGTLKHYVTFQGMNVGEFTATLTGANWASQTDETVYFQTDALGSTVAMTGGATEADAYDAWGKFRYPTGADDPADQLGATPPNRRYFTGEEYLANSGLTHLNGRLYDPAIGTMLSVDPITRVYDPQNLNPYGYVGNNPLNRVDPSGFGWFDVLSDTLDSVFSSIGNAFGDLFSGDGTSDAAGNGASSDPWRYLGTVRLPDGGTGYAYAAPFGSDLSAFNGSGILGVYANQSAAEYALGSAIASGSAIAGVSAPSSGQSGWTDVYSPITGSVQTGFEGSVTAQRTDVTVNQDFSLDSQKNAVYGGFQDAAYLGQTYDTGNPNYHYYVHEDAVCALSAACTTGLAFQGLLRYAAPGQTGVASTGNVVNVMFAGQSAGTITQAVDAQNLTVYNITDPGHIFDPGYVARSITVDTGLVMVRTVGEGTGNYPLFNESIAGPAWTFQDMEIRSYVLAHGAPGY